MLVNVDTYTYVFWLIELYLIEFRLLHFKNRLFRLFLYIEPQHSHQCELTFSKFPTFWMFSFLLITCEAFPLNSLPLYYIPTFKYSCACLYVMFKLWWDRLMGASGSNNFTIQFGEHCRYCFAISSKRKSVCLLESAQRGHWTLGLSPEQFLLWSFGHFVPCIASFPGSHLLCQSAEPK